MMGELKFFLAFQIKQMKEGTFLCQTKYVKDMLNRFGMADSLREKLALVTGNAHVTNQVLQISQER
jgi:GTPase Era involved in 16S rRNA processing